VIGMILIGRNSDKHHERRWHFCRLRGQLAPSALGITTLLAGNLVGSIIALSFATIGNRGPRRRLFFALITEYLSQGGGPAVRPIALISSLGNLGPRRSVPSLNGLIQQWTGSTAYGIYLVNGDVCAGGAHSAGCGACPPRTTEPRGA